MLLLTCGLVRQRCLLRFNKVLEIVRISQYGSRYYFPFLERYRMLTGQRTGIGAQAANIHELEALLQATNA